MGYLIRLFLMLTAGFGCGGYGGIGGGIGVSLLPGSILWSVVVYSSFNVYGGWWLVHGFKQVGSHIG